MTRESNRTGIAPPSPGIRDVSRVAGVSITTVSRVLNNSVIPSEATRRKVLEAVEKVGYRPDPLFSAALRRHRSGRGVEPVKTKTIGFLIMRGLQEAAHRHHEDYYSRVLSAVWNVASKQRYHVMFAEVDAGESRVPDLVAENRVDGLLVEAELSAALCKVLIHRLPTVFIDRTYADPAADAVVTDYVQAVTDVLGYLWQLGHRQIALFSDTDDRFYNQESMEGFRRFYESRGLPLPCPELSQPQDIHPDTNDRIITEYLTRLWATKPRPTAVVAVSNVYAQFILTHLAKAGPVVPRDLSVASLNDVSVGGAPVHPALTSYRASMERIGASATELLLQRIRDPQRPTFRLLVSGRMIERASCGPPPDTSELDLP